MENHKSEMPDFIAKKLPAKKTKKRAYGVSSTKYRKMRKLAVMTALWAILATGATAWLAYTNMTVLNPMLDIIMQDLTCEPIEQPATVKTPEIIKPANAAEKTTKASWYHYELNGVLYSADHRTAASREFARGSLVEVTNIENGKSVTVLINDYGPEEAVHPDRELDLSHYAFSLIADPSRGIINVTYKLVGTDPNFKSKY